MPRKHGAKQQKKAAKRKAKRAEKRNELARRGSVDPTVRLRDAERWPIVKSLVADDLWTTGLGYLVLARQESQGQVVFGVFLVDVYCLGVKDAFWKAGSNADFLELLARMEEQVTLGPIAPACLVKIVQGAVDYALSFGFRPHLDFQHASMLLDGIDPAGCPHDYTFGRDGKPFYLRGPSESPAQVAAIMERVTAAGGHYMVKAGPDDRSLFDEDDEFDEDDDAHGMLEHDDRDH